jgi:hypothetical protein
MPRQQPGTSKPEEHNLGTLGGTATIVVIATSTVATSTVATSTVAGHTLVGHTVAGRAGQEGAHFRVSLLAARRGGATASAAQRGDCQSARQKTLQSHRGQCRTVERTLVYPGAIVATCEQDGDAIHGSSIQCGTVFTPR